MKNMLIKYLVLGLIVGLIPCGFVYAGHPDKPGLLPPLPGEFTALSFEKGKKTAWIGVKTGGSLSEIYSYLFKMDLDSKIVKKSDAQANESPQNPLKIELPKSIQDRKIIGLASHQDKLLVITQWTIEQGDEPLVHVYFPAKNIWKMVGKIPCNSVASIELKNDALNYSCENEDNQVKTGEVKLPRNLMSGASNKIIPVTEEMQRARLMLETRIQMAESPL